MTFTDKIEGRGAAGLSRKALAGSLNRADEHFPSHGYSLLRVERSEQAFEITYAAAAGKVSLDELFARVNG